MGSLTKDGSGKFCAAKTWFSAVSAVVVIKFALAGIIINDFAFGQFDASGASMLIAAFGGVYWGRNSTKSKGLG